MYIRNVEETDDLEDVRKIEGWDKISFINRPVENRDEGIQKNLVLIYYSMIDRLIMKNVLLEGIFTLGRAVESLVPELSTKSNSEERVSSEEADPVDRWRIKVIRIQGILPRWDTPFAWVVNNLCHPDFFLHVSIFVSKSQSKTH